MLTYRRSIGFRQEFDKGISFCQSLDRAYLESLKNFQAINIVGIGIGLFELLFSPRQSIILSLTTYTPIYLRLLIGNTMTTFLLNIIRLKLWYLNLSMEKSSSETHGCFLLFVIVCPYFYSLLTQVSFYYEIEI